MNSASVDSSTPVATPVETTDRVGDPSIASACGHLFALTLRRQLFSRQTLVSLALSALVVVIAVAWSLQPRRNAEKLGKQILVTTFVGFLMPMFAISYGASCIGGEREDRTLIYLLITPIPRPWLYATKSLATIVLVWLWTGISLAAICACAIAGGLDPDPGWKVFGIFLPASLLGVTAYTALFLLFGAAVRHGTIISLAYWFFLEVIFGAMPGTVKRITVSFYIKSWIFDAGQELRLGPKSSVGKEMFLAVSGETAMLTLAVASLLFLAAGAAVFGDREYAELG